MINRLTMVYKIITNKVAIAKEHLFKDCNTKTRARHDKKLQTYKPRGNIDKYAFAQ